MSNLKNILVGATLIVGSFFGRSKVVAVSLVDDGKAVGVIIVAEKPTISAKLAARELQHHIEKITGALLEIKPDAEVANVKGVRILVGESEATRKRDLKNENFQTQEYLIHIKGDTIILMGRDWRDTLANRAEKGRGIQYSLGDTRKTIPYNVAVGRDDAPVENIELPGILDDQGTCYAVYDFLERCCGVRWYGPSLLNIVTPSQKTLAVTPMEIRRQPSLLYRYAPGGGWPILREQWDSHLGIQKDLFLRRIRFGGERWGCNHSFASFRDRFLFKNPQRPELFERSRPDFFALGWENEGFWRQLCMTNPDVIDQVVRDARDYFDGKGLKGRQLAIGDYFAVVPEDSDHWCKCAKCQAVLAKGKSRDIKYTFGTGAASDYVFEFVNAVAKEVKKTHPDKFITALAYHCYSYPPTFELESNVAVAPCVQLCYGYCSGVFKNDEKFYRQWIEENQHSHRRLYVWNYFHHPMERALINKFNCFPLFMPDMISKWIKQYVSDGVRGFYLCGIPPLPDYYLYMHTAFNADTDWQRLIDEFFTLYFGGAAEPMKKFYFLIVEINKEEGVIGGTEKDSWEKLGTAPRMEELGNLMRQAVASARTDIEKRRVETWKKGIWDYMVEGRRNYLKKKRAYEAKKFPIAVYSTGVNSKHRLLPDSAVDLHWRLADGGDQPLSNPNTYVVRSATAPIPPWSLQTSNSKSKWITPRADGVDLSPGVYVYEQKFMIDEQMDPETASLFGRVMGDDIVDRIEINGVKIAESDSFAQWVDFLIIEHLVAGENVLRVFVKNGGDSSNPHGMRLEISGSADGKQPYE